MFIPKSDARETGLRILGSELVGYEVSPRDLISPSEANMRPLKEYRNWPRRATFLILVIYASLVYGRIFSVVLVAAVFMALEIIFTRIANQRKVFNDFFSNYKLYERKDQK